MPRNDTAELLGAIRENAEMGRITIRELLSVTKDAEFSAALEPRLREYNDILQQAGKQIEGIHARVNGAGAVSKVSANVMVHVAALADKSPAAMAQMLVDGLTEGVADMRAKRRTYGQADEEALRLADRLLRFERQSLREMRRYV